MAEIHYRGVNSIEPLQLCCKCFPICGSDNPRLDIPRMWSVPRYDATKREKWRVANFILPASQQIVSCPAIACGLCKLHTFSEVPSIVSCCWYFSCQHFLIPNKVKRTPCMESSKIPVLNYCAGLLVSPRSLASWALLE